MNLDERMCRAWTISQQKLSQPSVDTANEWYRQHCDILNTYYEKFCKLFTADECPDMKQFVNFVWKNTEKIKIDGKMVPRSKFYSHYVEDQKE